MTRPTGERDGAIVLAGGRSSRFGRDKLAEPIDGRPMLQHAIDAVRQVATDIVVVTAPDGAPVPEAATDVVVAHDRRSFEGPLAGLSTGLAAFDPQVERVVVVGGDMPTLVPAVLRQLLDQLAIHAIAVLSDEVGPRPLPIAVRRSSVAPAVERLLASGERRLRELLAGSDVAVIAPLAWRGDDPLGATLRDVDVPDDLPG